MNTGIDSINHQFIILSLGFPKMVQRDLPGFENQAGLAPQLLSTSKDCPPEVPNILILHNNVSLCFANS
jgi:hypothetical protein